MDMNFPPYCSNPSAKILHLCLERFPIVILLPMFAQSRDKRQKQKDDLTTTLKNDTASVIPADHKKTIEVSSDIQINLQHPITLRSVLGSWCNNVM